MTETYPYPPAEPRWATRRTLERPTLGYLAKRFAAALDVTLMPWQQQVLDVALEQDPETGRFVYRDVGVTVPRQSGKDLCVLTPILTSAGWRTMGTVQVGDYVYGSDGEPTKVTYTSEVFTDHSCYEVEFTDGSVVLAGGDHQWRVWVKDGAYRLDGRWTTLTTAHMSTRFGVKRPDNGRMEYRYRVMCSAVVQTPHADLPVDPYTLGYWLGDGSAADGRFTCADEDQSELYEVLSKAGYSPHPMSHHHSVGTYGLRVDLRKAGVLNNKHIPPEYLTASPDQRRALLAGLLDSDGSIYGTPKAQTPRAEFSVCSERLAQDVHRLARSLGQRAVLRSNKAVLKRSGQEDYVTTRYRVTWTPTENPFRLARKASRWQAPVSDRQKWQSITDIRSVPSVPTRCIQVENPEHLYLVGDKFIPTHNTTLLEILVLLRGLGLDTPQTMVYTAQNHVAARKKVFDEWLPTLVGGRFGHLIAVRLANGQEQLRFDTGSTLSLVATTKKSGHGGSNDLVVLDEAFAQPDERMEQNLRPTMKARLEPQMWVVSTAGTEKESPYLFRRVNQGRLLVEQGINRGACYFEWSAPGGDDPSDEAVWAACNPALGYTITMDTLRSDFLADSEAGTTEFRRHTLNQWVSSMVAPVIDLDTWDSLRDETSMPVGQFALAFDVAADRSRSSVAICGRRDDGKYHVEVIKIADGTVWLPPYIARIWHERRPVGVYLAKNGPAGSLIADLRELNVPLVNDMPESDHAKACGVMYDAAYDGSIRHRGPDDLQADLRRALEGAVKRPMADAWAWNRKTSEIDISPLVAATFALYGMKEHARAPEVWSIRDIIEAKQKAAADNATPEAPATPDVPAPQRRPEPPKTGGTQFTRL